MLKDISVIIAEQSKIFRAGLNLVLSREKEIEVIGEADNDIQTISMASDLKPDVILLDYLLVEADSMKIIPAIRKYSPKTKSILLSIATEDNKIFEALKAGAKGFLQKAATASDLIRAIKTVHNGDMWVERNLISKFFDNFSENLSADTTKLQNQGEDLTMRELEVLCQLAEGRTNKEIAEALYISEKTVKSHLYSIFRKLNVTRRLDAVLCAIKQGLK